MSTPAPSLSEAMALVRMQCLHDRPHRGLFWMALMFGETPDAAEALGFVRELTAADTSGARNALFSIEEIQDMVAGFPEEWGCGGDGVAGFRHAGLLTKPMTLALGKRPDGPNTIHSGLRAASYSIMGLVVARLAFSLAHPTEKAEPAIPFAWLTHEMKCASPTSPYDTQRVADLSRAVSVGRMGLAQPVGLLASGFRDQFGVIHDVMDIAVEHMNRSLAVSLAGYALTGAKERDLARPAQSGPHEAEAPIVQEILGLHAIRSHDIAAIDGRDLLRISQPNVRDLAWRCADPTSSSTTVMSSILIEGGRFSPTTWGTHRRFGDIDQRENQPEWGCLTIAVLAHGGLMPNERVDMLHRLAAEGHDMVVARRPDAAVPLHPLSKFSSPSNSEVKSAAPTKNASLTNDSSIPKTSADPVSYTTLPIVSAAVDGDPDSVHALLELGADPHAMVRRQTTYKVDPTVSMDCALNHDKACATVIRSFMARLEARAILEEMAAPVVISGTPSKSSAHPGV